MFFYFKAAEAFGRIDILVSNAAVNPVFGMTEDVRKFVYLFKIFFESFNYH